MFFLHRNSHFALFPNIFQHLLHQNLLVTPFYFQLSLLFKSLSLYTHQSNQFRTLLLIPCCHHQFQLLSVSRPFSASLVTFQRALILCATICHLSTLQTLPIISLFNLLHSFFTNTFKYPEISKIFIMLPVSHFFHHMSTKGFHLHLPRGAYPKTSTY